MRKTKIICTIGPATDDPEVMKALISGGMDAVRVNFSHGEHEDHKKRIDSFRNICAGFDKSIPLILDTKGPEIRIGNFKDESVKLIAGSPFILTTEDVLGDDRRVSVSYNNMPKEVKKGDIVMIDDGLVELEVVKVQGREIHLTVCNNGIISNKKSVNLPGIAVSMPFLSEKDLGDLKFGIDNNFDFVALSFVRSPEDVLEVRRLLDKNGGNSIRIISKIENHQGVNNIEGILRLSDAIMIARGDLGVEMPIAQVPIVQRDIIASSIAKRKTVITATQMLDSMIRNPRPTRAEANDIANAINEGTSAIMLSGETAMGKYPVESLKTMVTIAETTENSLDFRERFYGWRYDQPVNITNAISHAACSTALNLNAAAILTVTKSGTTARLISSFRPACPVIAVTTTKIVQRQLNLCWGVYPSYAKEVRSTDDLFKIAVDQAFESGLVKLGDIVVISSGIPVGVSGTTNLIKAVVVGNVLAQGTGAVKGKATAELCVAKTSENATNTFTDGNILVMHSTCNDDLALIRRASALVVEEPALSCHAVTVGLALDIPVIVGVENATDILRSGVTVTVDADSGLIQHCG